MKLDRIKHKVEMLERGHEATNPFFARLEAGTCTKQEVCKALHSVVYVNKEMINCYAKAVKRSQELGLTQLGEYFLKRCKEEEQYSPLLKHDIETLEHKSYEKHEDGEYVAKSFKTLIAFSNELVEKDLRLFATCLVAADYERSMMNPKVMQDLVANCGIDRSALTTEQMDEKLVNERLPAEFSLLSKEMSGLEQDGEWERAVEKFLNLWMQGFSELVLH